MKRFFVYLMLLIISITLVSAVDFRPRANIDQQNTWNISNVPLYNGTQILATIINASSTNLTTNQITEGNNNLYYTSARDQNNYTITCSISGTTTKTIECSRNGMSNISFAFTDIDTDTTYTNGSGISLVGVQFNHSDTSSQTNSDNSGRTYIQDILLDAYGHITSITTATETVVDTDTNYYTINCSVSGTTTKTATCARDTLQNYTFSWTDIDTDTNSGGTSNISVFVSPNGSIIYAYNTTHVNATVNMTWLDTVVVLQSEYSNLDTDSTNDLTTATSFVNDTNSLFVITGTGATLNVTGYRSDLCVLLTGSSDLCDGSDAAGAGSFDLNVSNTSSNTIDVVDNGVLRFLAGRNISQISVVDDGGSVNVTIHAIDTDTNTQYINGSGISLVGTEFNHTDTSSQSSSDNSGRTYIQDIVVDTYGHITSLVTATETVTDTDTWNTTSEMRTAINNSGYYNISINASNVQNAPWITSYTETDPLWSGNASRVTALETSNTTTNTRIDNLNMSLMTNDSSQATQISNLITSNTTTNSRIDSVNTTAVAKAGPGTCAAGQVVQNTTTSGVQCVAQTVDTDTNSGYTQWRLQVVGDSISAIPNNTLVRLNPGTGITITNDTTNNITITSTITQYTDALAASAVQNTTIVRNGDANKTLVYCGNITGATSNLCTITSGGSFTNGSSITVSDIYIQNPPTECTGGNYFMTWFGGNSSVCRALNTSAIPSWFTPDDVYLYNSSTIIYFNESRLNATIELLDTDTWNTTDQMITAVNNSIINIGGNAATVTNGIYTTTTFNNASTSRFNITGAYNTLVIIVGANTLTGTDIDESTLSGVNAATLNGQSSTYYLNTSGGYVANNTDANLLVVNVTNIKFTGSTGDVNWSDGFSVQRNTTCVSVRTNATQRIDVCTTGIVLYNNSTNYLQIG